VFLLTVLTGSLVLLKTSRRRKRRTDGTTSARIAGGWAELCDLIRDMGGVVPATATRRECAVLVATPGVAAVAKTADSLIFGPGEISEYSVDSYWENLEVTRTGILGSMTLINRWKTLVNLSSLGLSKARLWRPRNARKKTGP
jgi:hypothetical protein